MTDESRVQANITGFWSAVARGYEAHGGNVPAESLELDAWKEAIRDLLPRAPCDVLDVGTWTGFAALIAAELGHRVTAIDLAEPMLAEARKTAADRGLEVRFECRDAVSSGLPAASRDAILCRHLVWTLRSPEAALRHWRELLRAGGRAVAIDGFWFRDPFPEEGPRDEVRLFERHYTPKTRSALPAMHLDRPAQVSSFFERAGFTDVEIRDLAAVHPGATYTGTLVRDRCTRLIRGSRPRVRRLPGQSGRRRVRTASGEDALGVVACSQDSVLGQAATS